MTEPNLFTLTEAVSFSAPLPPPDRRECLRYAGAREGDPETARLLSEILSEAESLPPPRLVYRVFSLQEPPPLAIEGATLSQYLSDCRYLCILAATAGHAYDRAARSAVLHSPARALLWESLGSERAEAMCDLFSAFVSERAKELGMRAKPRISPGYGDIPLSMQKELFSLLDCERRLGMTLNPSLLISPKKSVTAVIGI